MKRLFVAATAIEFSCGCHAAWRIFLEKSMFSTLTSSFFLRPMPSLDLVVADFFLNAVCQKKKGSVEKVGEKKQVVPFLDASRVTSFLPLMSYKWNELWYEPVIACLSQKKNMIL